MADTPANTELLVILQGIQGGVNRINNRLDAQQDVSAQLEEMRLAISRLEAKFDHREQYDTSRDNKLFKLDQKLEQLARAVAAHDSRLTKVEKSIASELDRYRGEVTKVYGKVLPDGD